MTELDQQVAEIKARAQRAAGDRARAEHSQQVAQAGLEAAQGQLSAEFGVTTLDDAQALLKQLEAEARAECTRVEQLLEAAERRD